MWLAALSVALAAAPSPASSAVEARWSQARASMERLDFRAALPVLEELVEVPEIQPGPRAEMMVALAITYLNLNKPDLAEAALKKAFAWDPAVTLPQRFATPRLQELFDAQQRAAAEAPAVSRPAAATASSRAAPGASAAAPKPSVTTELDAKRGPSWAPVIACGAVSAAAFATGAVLATQSQARAARLGEAPHPRAEVERLLGERQALATGSVVAYGAAGAAAVAAVALALVPASDVGEASAVSVAPWGAPNGAGLVLSVAAE